MVSAFATTFGSRTTTCWWMIESSDLTTAESREISSNQNGGPEDGSDEIVPVVLMYVRFVALIVTVSHCAFFSHLQILFGLDLSSVMVVFLALRSLQ